MKAELSNNDAVSHEAVAAANGENFALKVFGQADTEDRAGKATRWARLDRARRESGAVA